MKQPTPKRQPENLTKYCRHCGEKVKNTFIFIGYHPENGKELFNVRYSCPSKKHSWDGHIKGIWLGEKRRKYFYKDGVLAYD